ncbi:MAG: hypothetical protein IJ794_09780 [Lachnospiraceae bacterium]|nr:hypothetical protein [Lachnospiraceae bacterium]
MSQVIEISQAVVDALSNKEDMNDIKYALQSIDSTLKRIEKLLTPRETDIRIPVYIGAKKIEEAIIEKQNATYYH